MSKFAWVTLATNDSYSLGALVVAASLRRVATAHQIAVLITPGVTEAMRTKLSTVFDVVKEVNILDSRDSANLALLARPELGVTFTKLHCWNLTQYEKCVFLDADTLVLHNCDELFEREEFAAAPDVGWPDCFNSGVFVFRPSQDTFGKILDFAVKAGSFDGGDQGLLNLYFADWAHSDISKHLPFVYNTCSTATYSYLPAFKQYGQGVKIIHFIGTAKPWLQNFDPQTRTVRTPDNYSHLASHLQTWWTIFFEQIHPHLSGDMFAFEDIPGLESGIAGALASVTLGEKRTPEQEAWESQVRRQSWESGNIDYMGKDSFENILKRINVTMGVTEETPKEEEAPKKAEEGNQ
uniref:glycogenin glucosyltransferase n=1 Tax=Nyssomyia neivai TaxID=330878 RepID=A0A1L8E298_9DIPT